MERRKRKEYSRVIRTENAMGVISRLCLRVVGMGFTE